MGVGGRLGKSVGNELGRQLGRLSDRGGKLGLDESTYAIYIDYRTYLIEVLQSIPHI
jgi:hypothetical protein